MGQTGDRDKTADTSVLTRDMRFLERMLMIVMLAMLLISACLNVYAFSLNYALSRDIGNLQQQTGQLQEVSRYTGDMVRQLFIMSEHNKDVRDLLRSAPPGYLNLFGIDPRILGAPPSGPVPQTVPTP